MILVIFVFLHVSNGAAKQAVTRNLAIAKTFSTSHKRQERKSLANVLFLWDDAYTNLKSSLNDLQCHFSSGIR